MDLRAIPGAADAAVYPIEEAREALQRVAQNCGFSVAEALLAGYLPEDKLFTGTIDDVPYDRLPAVLAASRAALERNRHGWSGWRR